MDDKEINAKLKACKTPEELKAVAKEIGYELTDEEADAYFKQLTESGELSDDELTNVSGGTCFRQRNREIYCIKKPQYLIV
ncbi:MAG: Nif11-like leader peptide family RiPP precursor, partial [Bacilli bacterium]|nr:Nif11-like leader peptide family RiPP precursor [Bacilli bacterium]